MAIGSPLVGPGGVPATGHVRRSGGRAGRSADRMPGELSRAKSLLSETNKDDHSQNQPADSVHLHPESGSLSLTGELGADGGNLSGSNGAENSMQRKRQLEKDEYQVERIVGVRSNGGELQYLIKWKGWQPKFNTWEPLHHLKNLQSEIDSFEGSLKATKFS